MEESVEYPSKCAACGTLHAVFESRSDASGAPTETRAFRCVECGQNLFESQVAPGTFIVVLLESDPQVQKLRAERESPLGKLHIAVDELRRRRTLAIAIGGGVLFLLVLILVLALR